MKNNWTNTNWNIRQQNSLANHATVYKQREQLLKSASSFMTQRGKACMQTNDERKKNGMNI